MAWDSMFTMLNQARLERITPNYLLLRMVQIHVLEPCVMPRVEVALVLSF